MRRPYITRFHVIVEILSYLFVAAAFVVALVGALTLPEEIPSHFDVAGNIDGYEGKWVLFLMPGIMLATMLVVSVTTHLTRSEKWNFPFTVKEDRRLFVYRDCVTMNMLINLILGVYTLFVELAFCYHSGKWITITTIALCIALAIIIIAECVAMARHNR